MPSAGRFVSFVFFVCTPCYAPHLPIRRSVFLRDRRLRKDLIEQLIKPDQDLKSISRRIQLLPDFFIVLQRKTISHIDSQSSPFEDLELRSDAGLVQK